MVAIADFKAALDQGRALGVSAGVGFALAGVGVVVTFGFGASARRQSVGLPP